MTDEAGNGSNGAQPPKRRGITLEDFDRMEVDDRGRLIWDDKLVQVEKRLTFSLWQTMAAVIVTVAAAAQGGLAFFDFGCRLAWWSVGCPK